MTQEYDFNGTVETWNGEATIRARGTVQEDARGDSCALCDDEAVAVQRLPIEWEHELVDRDQDFWTPWESYIVLCPPCDYRVEVLRDGERDIGYYDDEETAKIEAAREAVLSALSPDDVFADDLEVPE